jgi:hypothetical protein
VKPVWQRLAERAAGLGAPVVAVTFTDDPALHIRVDGRSIQPVMVEHRRCLFVLPRRAGPVRLVSRTGYPTETRPWADDWRRLSVYVSRILWHGQDRPSDMPVDHPSLGDGWWAVECADLYMRRWPYTRRWTDGDALLSPPSGARTLEIYLEGGMTYRAGSLGVGGLDLARAA